ncbi:hypothetical protein GALMADRAFT_260402, partial [Galerina marginata CBS 339.88]
MALNDLEALSFIISLMILMHAVQRQAIASSSPNVTTWSRLISSFLEHHQDLVKAKISTLIPQVANIVQDIHKHRTFLTKVINSMWQFSDKTADTFATKLVQCVKDNL